QAQGDFAANASQQIVVSGLDAGQYTDIHVVTPQLCNSDTVSSLQVPGVGATATITGAVSTNPGSCTAADGTITLSGTFNNGASPYVTFTRNGVAGVVSVSGNATQIQLTGLSAGIYEDICVVDGCPSTYWGPVDLSDGSSPSVISSVSSAS